RLRIRRPGSPASVRVSSVFLALSACAGLSAMMRSSSFLVCSISSSVHAANIWAITLVVVHVAKANVPNTTPTMPNLRIGYHSEVGRLYWLAQHCQPGKIQQPGQGSSSDQTRSKG